SEMRLMRAVDGRFAVGDLVTMNPNPYGYQMPARVMECWRDVHSGNVYYRVENDRGSSWTVSDIHDGWLPYVEPEETVDPEPDVWLPYMEDEGAVDPEPEPDGNEPPFAVGDIVVHNIGSAARRRVTVDGTYMHDG